MTSKCFATVAWVTGSIKYVPIPPSPQIFTFGGPAKLGQTMEKKMVSVQMFAVQQMFL